MAKKGRFGPYVTEVFPEPDEPADDAPKKKKASAPKPKTASLFQSMEIETIDLETALRLLALPREVGVDPESGEMITAQNGRYGPYLKKGTDTRSLDSEEKIFEIDVEGALQRFAEPKYGGGAKPLLSRLSKQTRSVESPSCSKTDALALMSPTERLTPPFPRNAA